MIKIFCEPEQPAPEIAELRTELQQLRQTLSDRTALFGSIITGQQEILSAIKQDASLMGQSQFLLDNVTKLLTTLTDQMATHLQQLASDCTQSEPDSLPGTAARLEASK